MDGDDDDDDDGLNDALQNTGLHTVQAYMQSLSILPLRSQLRTLCIMQTISTSPPGRDAQGPASLGSVEKVRGKAGSQCVFSSIDYYRYVHSSVC